MCDTRVTFCCADGVGLPDSGELVPGQLREHGAGSEGVGRGVRPRGLRQLRRAAALDRVHSVAMN